MMLTNVAISLGRFGASALLLTVAMQPLPGRAQTSPYPKMASLERYLEPDAREEAALARSAAPAAISKDATVLVLTKTGYVAAATGTNGFTCLVERSWMKHFEDPDFWNWHMRAPVCYNPGATHSIVPYTVFRTNLAVKGASKSQLLDAVKAAIANGQLPALELGSMGYMMSKQQYLVDVAPANGVTASSWHPHVMFYEPAADAANSGASFGANTAGSPVIFDTSGGAIEPWTVFFVPVWHWSDGSPGPVVMHH